MPHGGYGNIRIQEIVLKSAILFLILCQVILASDPKLHPINQDITSLESAYLEFPKMEKKKNYYQGVVKVRRPQDIQRVLIHIPKRKVFQVFTKINTFGVGIIQTLRVRKDEVICDLDLGRYARRYAFEPEANTLEVKIIPSQGAEPLFASWVIVPSRDYYSWSVQELDNDGNLIESIKQGYQDIVLFEEIDQDYQRLNHGFTISDHLQVQARFSKNPQRGQLRVQHFVGDMDLKAKVYHFGFENKIYEISNGTFLVNGLVDLLVGFNKLEVEVWSQKNLLDRRTFFIQRREKVKPDTFTGEKWAVIVGISDYRHNDGALFDLEYADVDAIAIQKFLVGREGGGYQSDRIKLLTNRHATFHNIRTALFTFLAETGPEDLVFIYMAGHGVPDLKNPDNYFFLAHDSKLSNLGGTALPMWDLQNVMDFTIRAQRIVVLADTCHGGAVVRVPGARGTRPFNFFNKYLEALGREEGRLVLTASRADEWSQEGTQWGGGHGVFTYTLLRGLRGEGDVNLDGVVTAGELLDYIRFVVPQETKGKQHPSYNKEGFNPNFPLAFVSLTP